MLNEYAKLRESQNARGTYKHSNKANQQQTSDYMLRQIVRVSKFWHEYCGKKPVDKIERWSRKFGPVVKVDRMKKVMIQNDKKKEPFARFQSQGCA